MIPEHDQAGALARWLDEGGEVPTDLDVDVVEAIVALKPELAPPARVSADDILALVEVGPLAAPSAVGEPVAATVEAPTAEIIPLRRPWVPIALGGGALSLLAAAAAVVVVTLGSTATLVQSPDPVAVRDKAEEARERSDAAGAAPETRTEEAGATGEEPPPPAQTTRPSPTATSKPSRPAAGNASEPPRSTATPTATPVTTPAPVRAPDIELESDVTSGDDVDRPVEAPADPAPADPAPAAPAPAPKQAATTGSTRSGAGDATEADEDAASAELSKPRSRELLTPTVVVPGDTPAALAVRSRLDKLQQCWRDAIGRGTAPGTLVVQARVGTDGKVSEATVVDPAVSDTLLIRCVEREVGRVQLEASASTSGFRQAIELKR